MIKAIKAMTMLAASYGLLGLLPGCGKGSSSTPAPVNPSAPAIRTQPVNALVGAGESAAFSVKAEGTPPVSFQWLRNGVAIDGATSPDYATPPATEAMNGTRYSVTVGNGIGAPVSSKEVELTVGLAPAITSQPANVDVTAPAAATFTVGATGRPLSYQWYGPSGLLDGQTGATLKLDPTSASMNGNYQVTVTGFRAASIKSDLALLRITSPPAILTQPTGGPVNAGAALHLAVVAAGFPAPAYQWFRNAAAITGANAAAYDVAAAAGTDAGTYFVRVSNSLGAVDSNTVTVEVAESHAISGRVTLKDGSPAAGLTLAINTTPAATVQTDAGGVYRFPAVRQGAWTLTPSAPAFASSFQPASREVILTGADATADFQVALGYTVSGTVNYPGASTGPVYVRLFDAGSATVLGTVLPGPGAFSMRGVPSGTYFLSGSLDPSLGGVFNHNNPGGTTPLTVVGADLPGQVLDLVDPTVSVAGRIGPFDLWVSPMASGAVVQFDPMIDPFTGVERARQYVVEWSTDAAFTPVTGRRTFLANGMNGRAGHAGMRRGYTVIIDPRPGLDNLTDGTNYYFRVVGQAGGTTSLYSTLPAPVRIGAPPPGFSITGRVQFTGTAKGPLYVGYLPLNAGLDNACFTRIETPVSPQDFTIVVDLPGDYQLTSFIDQNNNSMPDTGDSGSVQALAAGFTTIDSSRAIPDVILNTDSDSSSLGSGHVRTAGSPDAYQIVFNHVDGARHVAALTVLSGPGILTPLDLGNPFEANGFIAPVDLAWGVPVPGQGYPVQVRYSDGTVETRTMAVTAVLDAFAQNPRMTGADRSMPDFEWDAPLAPPAAGYTCRFELRAPTGEVLRQDPPASSDPALPSTTTNTIWDPFFPPLAAGSTYKWSITVWDKDGNFARLVTDYTP